MAESTFVSCPLDEPVFCEVPGAGGLKFGLMTIIGAEDDDEDEDGGVGAGVCGSDGALLELDDCDEEEEDEDEVGSVHATAKELIGVALFAIFRSGSAKEDSTYADGTDTIVEHGKALTGLA